MTSLFGWLIWAYQHPEQTLYTLLGVALAFVLLLTLINRVPLSYNVLNLFVRWRNTALTGLAFMLVIGLLTMMLGFVNGMYALTQKSGQPGNVLVLAEGATDESFSNLGFSDLSDLENQPGVYREADGRALASRETFLIANQPITNPQPGRPKRRFLQVRGIDDPERSARVHGLKLLEGGNWFSEAGVRDIEGQTGPSLVEVVVGYGLAGELGADRSAEARAQAKNQERIEVGESFIVGERTWLVVGVLAQSGSTYDSEVWAKQSLIGPMFGKNTVTTLVVRTVPDRALVEELLTKPAVPVAEKSPEPPVEKPAENTAQKPVNVVPPPPLVLSKAARKLLLQRIAAIPADAPNQPVPLDGLTQAEREQLVQAAARRYESFLKNDYEKSAVAPRLETEYFQSLSSTNLQFLVAIIVVTLIMSLGGIFGVMNTMFASVSQRTKDIGVLRLLGYKRWQILVSFLLESLVLAFLGGMAGCALGWLADGWTANSIVSSGAGGGGKFVVLRITIDTLVTLTGMLLAIGMGFLGGLIPSLSAMRLTALQALR